MASRLCVARRALPHRFEDARASQGMTFPPKGRASEPSQSELAIPSWSFTRAPVAFRVGCPCLPRTGARTTLAASVPGLSHFEAAATWATAEKKKGRYGRETVVSKPDNFHRPKVVSHDEHGASSNCVSNKVQIQAFVGG